MFVFGLLGVSTTHQNHSSDFDVRLQGSFYGPKIPKCSVHFIATIQYRVLLLAASPFFLQSTMDLLVLKAYHCATFKTIMHKVFASTKQSTAYVDDKVFRDLTLPAPNLDVTSCVTSASCLNENQRYCSCQSQKIVKFSI